MKKEFQSACQSSYLPNPGQKNPFFCLLKLVGIGHACVYLPLFGINRRGCRSRRYVDRRRRKSAGWRRRVTRWWRWRRDSSFICPHYTWDLIPLCIHTLHVGIVISPLEGPFLPIRFRFGLLASPLPASGVIGLEYFKRLPRARPYHDAWARRNRCTGA